MSFQRRIAMLFGVAFGEVAGSPPDRLFVGLALLGLLSQLAADQPRPLYRRRCTSGLIESRHRPLPSPARRLMSEHIAFLFAARAVPA